MKIETETVKCLVDYLRQARKVKASLIRMANDAPEDFLGTYSTLEPREQKYLGWLKDIAQRQLPQAQA
jgi:hypothetical protein